MPQNLPQLYALSLKINIDQDLHLLHNVVRMHDDEYLEPQNFWDDIDTFILKPFHKYLSYKNVEAYGYTSGLHTMGKKQKEHVHFHITSTCDFEKELPNILSNYKYYYHSKYRIDNSGNGLYNEDHFKKYKHAHQVKPIRAGLEVETGRTTCCLNEAKRFHAYCFKECVDQKHLFKANVNYYLFPPSTVEELIALGSGLYLDALAKHQKTEKKEELKMEKWGHFCQYMDDLFETPTYQEMKHLRGICLIALDYFRKQPERTSVNAVITMCKDYSFKRNIWTNNEILDKYGIV